MNRNTTICIVLLIVLISTIVLVPTFITRDFPTFAIFIIAFCGICFVIPIFIVLFLSSKTHKTISNNIGNDNSLNSSELDTSNDQDLNDTIHQFYKIILFQYDENVKHICIICKLEIRKNQNVYQCPVCLNYYHEDHLEEWLRNNSTCLICNSNLVIEN